MKTAIIAGSTAEYKASIFAYNKHYENIVGERALRGQMFRDVLLYGSYQSRADWPVIYEMIQDYLAD